MQLPVHSVLQLPVHEASAFTLHLALQSTSSLPLQAASKLTASHWAVQPPMTSTLHMACAETSMFPQSEMPAWASRGASMTRGATVRNAIAERRDIRRTSCSGAAERYIQQTPIRARRQLVRTWKGRFPLADRRWTLVLL